MRFATRTFLSSFVPFAVLLAITFWAIRASVIVTVRQGLRASVLNSEKALAREQLRNEERERKWLKGIAENPTLKARLQVLTNERPGKDQAPDAVKDLAYQTAQQEARLAVEGQLGGLCDSLGFDFILISGVHGEPLAGVLLEAGGFAPISFGRVEPPEHGFFSVAERLYEVNSVPVQEAGVQIATLTVGGRFDISRFGVPAVLLHKGAVVATQMRDIMPVQIEKALAMCAPRSECELHLQNQTYLSLPLGLPVTAEGDTYVLRSLQSMDAAGAPLQAILQKLLLMSGVVVLASMCGISLLASRLIARPLDEVAEKLRLSAATGELPEFSENNGDVQEIRDLTRSFNHAANAIRESRGRLTQAYVQFVGSLAQALDARDAYTAGHSRRVSEYSCAIAEAMHLPGQDLEIIRVGALLHDLGKIGISDLVLQKPGRLTTEENELIQQHPVIGKRILEGVLGLEPYLGVVELHHENLDGTGYPHGLRGEQTPLHARIVKVADAYDAMTSNRPYRRGKTHEEAIAILRTACGSEMDPVVVEAFAILVDRRRQQGLQTATPSLQRLSDAVENGFTLAAPQL